MRPGFKQACKDIAEKYGWELIRDSGGHYWWGSTDRTAGIKRIATATTPASESLELQSLEAKLRAAMRERGINPDERAARLARVSAAPARAANRKAVTAGALDRHTIRQLERIADPGWVTPGDLVELTGERTNASAMRMRLNRLVKLGVVVRVACKAARTSGAGGRTPVIYRLAGRDDGNVNYVKPRLASEAAEPLASDVRADEPAAVPVSVSAVAAPVLHADFNEQVQHIAEEIARIVAYRVSDLEDQVNALTKERDAAIARLEAIEDILTRATDVKVAE